MTIRFTFFDSLIGRCAILWSASGVCGVQLPETGEAPALSRIARRWSGAEPGAPDANACSAIAEIGKLLAGAAHDFGGLRLDREGISAFNGRVYDLVLAIPPGETRSYGEIARALGDVGLSRAVGRALGENPLPILIPCHRVMAANGGTGGFSAPGGLDTKFQLLNIELAFAKSSPGLFGDAPLVLARRPSR